MDAYPRLRLARHDHCDMFLMKSSREAVVNSHD
jgi:hypothetical protein